MTFSKFGPTFVDNPNRKYRDKEGGEGGEAHWSAGIKDDTVRESMSGYETQDKLFETIGYTPRSEEAFPDNWRNQFAGELAEDADDDAKEAHEKTLKTLGRFQSPNDVWKSQQEAHKKISAGEVNKPLGDKPTEQELKDYRVTNGIPEKAEGYLESLGDLVVGENDKPHIDSFLKNVAHPNNWTPAQVKDAITWQQKNMEEQLAAFDAQNNEAGEVVTKELQKEWGSEYKGNVTRVNNLLAIGGTEFAERIANASMDDGVSLFNDKDTMKVLLNWANEIDPIPTSIGGAGANADTVTSRLQEIEKVMNINRKTYNKDKPMQAEYLELIDAYGKLSGKAWGG